LGIASPIVPTLCVPAPFAIAVPVGQPALRVPFAVGDPGELTHLGFHHGLGENPHALAQEIDVTLGQRLAHRLEYGHPVLGHRCLHSLASSVHFQRREDDAVAASIHGRPAVTPNLGT
jgi:hypothetical protein